MASEFPKEVGGGWYELSNEEKVQGEDEAKEAQAKLDEDSGSSEDAPKKASKKASTDKGKIGASEDDPRRGSPLEGRSVTGYAESGEPIVEGGVPSTSGVPEEAVGTTDPELGVAKPVDVALAEHEADRESWMSKDEADYDGSPADRLKFRGSQNPSTESD